MSCDTLCDMIERNQQIIKLYTSGTTTTEQIAKQFSVTPRTIQRIAKAEGVVRTVAQANAIAAPLKKYKNLTIPKKIQEYKKTLTYQMRKNILDRIGNHVCSKCGIERYGGCIFEVVFHSQNHYDFSPENTAAICRNCLYRMLY